MRAAPPHARGGRPVHAKPVVAIYREMLLEYNEPFILFVHFIGVDTLVVPRRLEDYCDRARVLVSEQASVA
jgi:hypothetical protein